jgi:cell shape-determining protein MreD
MFKSSWSVILLFVLTIAFTILVLPYLPIFLRPNLILAFIILCSFLIGFQKSIWYWIIGGIILDSFILFKWPINSIIFIGLFVILIFFAKTFDYTTRMSKIIMSLILIFIYYATWFLIDWMALKKINIYLFLYLIETIIVFEIIFKLIYKNHREEKTLSSF